MNNYKTAHPARFWGALSLVLFFFSCTSIKDPVFNGISELKVTGIGMNESTLSLQLNYFNPNKSGLWLKNAEGDAWMDDNLLGHFKMDTSIRITGNTDFVIPVQLGVDMKNAVKNAAALLFKQEINFRIDGKAKIGKGGVFINYPIRYEGKQDVSKLFQ
ncbi:MAG TPA: LEA type 2 family protein [Chitinophagaceae bacterium]|nr:LEA type 2 family protein [Chitinophagaceae bacterium]